MSKKHTFSSFPAGFFTTFVFLSLLSFFHTTHPVFAASIQGTVETQILYSDSGILTESPPTGTDLDNFTISLKYGTMDEYLGDTLELHDAAVYIPITVNIEYRGQEHYQPGELSFTLQDLEGLQRSYSYLSCVSTDIGADLYGSNTNRGDWYYTSEKMENGSNAYLFTNKNEITSAFTSSVEMLCMIASLPSVISGFQQEISSTLSINGLGCVTCHPLSFSNYTSPTEWEMKEFQWEPYLYDTYGMVYQDVSLFGYSLEDYYAEKITLDYQETRKNRSFSGTQPSQIGYQEASFGQFSITGPEGVLIINPNGAANTPLLMETPFEHLCIPLNDLDLQTENWNTWYAMVPKSLYPEGTEILITASLDGAYYDDLAPFHTSVTQTVKVIPTRFQADGELFSPKKIQKEVREYLDNDGKINRFLATSSTTSVHWLLYDYAPMADIQVTKTVITDDILEWTDILKEQAADVGPEEYRLRSITLDAPPEESLQDQIRVYVKQALDASYTLAYEDTVGNLYSFYKTLYSRIELNLLKYNAQYFQIEIEGKAYTGAIEICADVHLDPSSPSAIQEAYLHNVAKLHVESEFLQDGQADLFFNCCIPDRAYQKLEDMPASLQTYLDYEADPPENDRIRYRVSLNGTIDFRGYDLEEILQEQEVRYELTYPSWVQLDTSGTILRKLPKNPLFRKSTFSSVSFNDPPEQVSTSIETTDNPDGTKTTRFTVTLPGEESFFMNHDSGESHQMYQYLSGITLDLPVDLLATMKEKGTLPSTIPVTIKFVPSREKSNFSSMEWIDQNTGLPSDYAISRENLEIPSFAGNTYQGIHKFVKTASQPQYTQSATVNPGEEYTYKLRISGGQTQIENIIFYDNLEQAYGDSPHWNGTFLGVDTYALELLGCSPVIYYSTDPLQPHDLSAPGWTEKDAFQASPAEVKSIAISLNNYKVPANTSAYAEIRMAAPSVPYQSKACNAYTSDYTSRDTSTQQILETVRDLPSNITVVSLPAENILITGIKQWDDAGDQDGIRPENVQFELLANGTVIDTGSAAASGFQEKWEIWFQDRLYPKYDETGIPIAYSIRELPIAGYLPAYDARWEETLDETENGTLETLIFTVTNTHVPETLDIFVQKRWDDSDNQDGLRPAEISIELYQNDQQPTDQAILSEENGWRHTFSGFPKYRHGDLIEYHILEKEIPSGYESVITGSAESGFTITNTYDPEKTTISVQKIWDDSDNHDGKRPASVPVQLLANGNPLGEPVLLTAENSWTCSWTNLDKYHYGQPVSYMVEEDPVFLNASGYETESIRQEENNTIIITNKRNPETISLTVQKIWDDNNNQDGIRPEAVTFRLLSDGAEYTSQQVTISDNWVYTWENLPKYQPGHPEAPICYTITEDTVDGYTLSSIDQDGTFWTFTNQHDPSSTSVTVTKAWNDGNNRDGIRPESILVQLYANQVIHGEPVLLNNENDWTATWSGLPTNALGNKILYSISETEDSTGYLSSIEGNMETGFRILNTHEPEKITISGEKIWRDNDDQDHLRPGKITIYLLADGKKVDSTIASEETGWKFSFENVWKNEAGRKIPYTVTEDPIETVIQGDVTLLYETEIKGTTIINTLVPPTITIEGQKTWEDEDNADGLRPKEITIRLFADGEEIETTKTDEAHLWSYCFQDLPIYKAGVPIEYTINEDDIPGYTKVIKGYNLTNIHHVDRPEQPVPELITISGTKTWIDSNNADQLRPTSIIIRLFANDEEVSSKEVTAKNNWNFCFKDLPKSDHGKPIKYTIDEDPVPGYTKTIQGYQVTNTHPLLSVTVTPTPTIPDPTGSRIETPVQTGDSSPLLILFSLLGFSGFMIISFIYLKKKPS